MTLHDGTRSKSPPPDLTRKEFREGAEQLTVAISTADGTVLYTGVMEPRLFSTSTVGWHAHAKAWLPLGTKKIYCVLNLLASVVRSKEIEDE